VRIRVNLTVSGGYFLEIKKNIMTGKKACEFYDRKEGEKACDFYDRKEGEKACDFYDRKEGVRILNPGCLQ
jgi:hypothetical protein